MARLMMSPISCLAQRLRLYDDDDTTSIEDLKEDVLFLTYVCPMIKAVQRDADEWEIEDDCQESVKRWLLDLRYLAVDAEYTLEDYEYYLEREKEIPRVSSTTHSHDERKRILERIRTIQERFHKINESKPKTIKLREYHGNRQIGDPPNEPIMCGRDEDQENLLDLLLDDMMPYRRDEYTGTVIGLIGISGIGKTTLAQKLYNDAEIENHFDCKCWVTVSETFDVVQITKNILESLTKEASNLRQLSAIQNQLEIQLEGKKYFIVLDDMWEKEELYRLEFLLQLGSMGSKILITTTISGVIMAMHPSIPYDLKPLRIEDGWELFLRHAFQGTSEHHVALDLEEIDRKIVERCKGIPLLLKLLGDNFRQDVSFDKKRWRETFNHETWEINDESGNKYAMKILKRSYIHLPWHLKACFFYCSLFPKGYSFHMVELAQLWTAHGLIDTKGSQQVIDIGEEYVHNLLQRSFMEKGVYGQEFYLHDIMHNLGQYILKSEQSLRKNHELMIGTSQTLRHYYEPIAQQTFVHYWKPFIQKQTIDMLAQHWKGLRVLIIKDDHLTFLPNSIENLKYLRYLCLWLPQLSTLPKSVCSLFNLQTLECYPFFEKLSSDIKKLKRLQHLIASKKMQIPIGIGELIKLQTLRNFHVSTRRDECARLSELKNLRQLGGELQISGLENIDGVEEARLSSLSNKPNLKHLTLEWNVIEGYDYQQSKLVLDNLEPHNNLKVLLIYKYAGVEFPTWMGNQSFNKLMTVSLSTCHKCVELPTLGQLPSLKYLSIEEMPCLKCIGPEFYGSNPSDAFPCLKTLELSTMDSLTKWWGMDKCPFPQLSALSLTNCNSLRFSSFDADVEHQVGLARMFDTVVRVIINRCPHVEEWCRAHKSTILAEVELMISDDDESELDSEEEPAYYWRPV